MSNTKAGPSRSSLMGQDKLYLWWHIEIVLIQCRVPFLRGYKQLGRQINNILPCLKQAGFGFYFPCQLSVILRRNCLIVLNMELLVARRQLHCFKSIDFIPSWSILKLRTRISFPFCATGSPSSLYGNLLDRVDRKRKKGGQFRLVRQIQWR